MTKELAIKFKLFYDEVSNGKQPESYSLLITDINKAINHYVGNTGTLIGKLKHINTQFKRTPAPYNNAVIKIILQELIDILLNDEYVTDLNKYLYLVNDYSFKKSGTMGELRLSFALKENKYFPVILADELDILYSKLGVNGICTLFYIISLIMVNNNDKN
jgi:hypothetical protein